MIVITAIRVTESGEHVDMTILITVMKLLFNEKNTFNGIIADFLDSYVL